MDTSIFYSYDFRPSLLYIYEFLSSFIPFLIILMLSKQIQKKKGIYLSPISFVLILVFMFYIYGVYHFTDAGTLYEGLRYKFKLRNNLNFIPFSEEIDILGYLLNVLLFIPWGIILPLIWDKMECFVYVAAAGFSFSLLIEMSQLLNIRATDVDDLILNTAGAIVGFGLYKLFSKCTKSRYQQKGVPLSILMLCILSSYIGRFLFFNEMGLAKLLYGF